MRKRKSWLSLGLFLLVALPARSEEKDLVRADLAALKKKLVAVLAALGAPPDGYAKEEEDFVLPTQVSTHDVPGRFRPVSASVNLRYGSAAAQSAEQTGEALGQEFQKKMAEAMAKGDHEAMARLTTQMQQKMGQVQLAAVEGRREPVSVQAELNAYASETIDPDAVLFEQSGAIALLESQDARRTRATVYFDPVSLKETESLSRVDLDPAGERGVKGKTSVSTVRIVLEGPADAVKSWVERIDARAVLAHIDGDAR